MNFATLVESMFLCEENAEQAEMTANNAAGFLLKLYPKISQDYKQKYNNYEQFRNAFPSEQDYKAFIYNAANAAVRTVKDSDRYTNIRDLYPVLDLVGLVVQNFSKAMGGNEQKAEAVYTEFINKLKASKGAPIEYEPISPWAKSVKDDFFAGRQKIDLGKLRLESPEFKNQSLYFVIQKLFQLRLIGRSGILKLDDPNIPTKSQKFVDKFLFDTNSYISGTKPVPEQGIKDLYNDVSPNLLLEIAKNAYAFFEQQADVNVGGVGALEGKKNEAFKLFLTNKIDWGLYKANSTVPPPLPKPQPATLPPGAPPPPGTLQTAGLTTFNSLAKRILNEMVSGTGMAGLKATTQKNQSQEPKEETSEEKPQPFLDKNGKSDYSLENLIVHKAQVPAANNLYNSLVKLSDFLRKETQADWKGVFAATAQIAQALSFGVPTQGGKR